MIGREPSPKERSMIVLTFDQTVETTEYFYPEFDDLFADFLSSLGGSLGFWLGVGVVQIGEYVALLLCKIKIYIFPKH